MIEKCGVKIIDAAVDPFVQKADSRRRVNAFQPIVAHGQAHTAEAQHGHTLAGFAEIPILHYASSSISASARTTAPASMSPAAGGANAVLPGTRFPSAGGTAAARGVSLE